MDTFPWDSWDEAFTAATEADSGYYTFAGSGEVVLTILGAIAMVAALVAWVVKENQRLTSAAAELRAEMDEGA